MEYWRRRIEFPQAPVFKAQLWEKAGISVQDKHECAFQSAPLNISHISLVLRRGLCSVSLLSLFPIYHLVDQCRGVCESCHQSSLSVWLWLTHSILLHLCGGCWHGDGVWLTAALTVTTLPACLWPGVGISGQLDERDTQAVRWTAARLLPLISPCSPFTSTQNPSTAHIKLYTFFLAYLRFCFGRKSSRYSDASSASKLMTDARLCLVHWFQWGRLVSVCICVLPPCQRHSAVEVERSRFRLCMSMF